MTVCFLFLILFIYNKVISLSPSSVIAHEFLLIWDSVQDAVEKDDGDALDNIYRTSDKTFFKNLRQINPLIVAQQSKKNHLFSCP